MSKYINPISASVRSMKKIKQGSGIEGDGGKHLGWVNRDGSPVEEEVKLESHAGKELLLRE